MDKKAATIERLYRQASERLTTDSGLRDALDDMQAQQLLDWGLQRLRQSSDAAGALPTAEAQRRINEAVHKIGVTMRRLNRLIDDAAQGRQELYVAVLRFVEALYELGVPSLSPAQLTTLEEIAVQAQELSPQAIFSRLINILLQDEEE